MIAGIGIDSVEIARFEHWHAYDKKKLLRIFSEEEINYCRAHPLKSAERFAVRFAVREALYKALSQACPTLRISFLTLCKSLAIIKKNEVPQIAITNCALTEQLQSFTFFISLTHTHTTATAVVVIQKI